jgi:hypothetical protein
VLIGIGTWFAPLQKKKKCAEISKTYNIYNNKNYRL